MLAMEHALTQPQGLRAMAVANSPASMKLWVAEADRMRSLLPAEVQETLARHEAAGTTDSKEYEKAAMVFYERHECRIVPFPDCLQRSFAQIDEDPTVYHTMNGPSEFHVIGTLRDWDITARLREIHVPVLVISGEHDEATPAVVRPLVEALPDVRWELVDGASHCTHLERPELFLDLVETFLAAHDQRG
jgi:L-proline amide hydrolase